MALRSGIYLRKLDLLGLKSSNLVFSSVDNMSVLLTDN